MAGLLRRLVAFVALAAMVGLFVCPPVARIGAFDWLPRIQLVPAVAAGSVFVLVCIAVSVALCGRLYCSTVCPLILNYQVPDCQDPNHRNPKDITLWDYK